MTSIRCPRDTTGMVRSDSGSPSFGSCPAYHPFRVRPCLAIEDAKVLEGEETAS